MTLEAQVETEQGELVELASGIHGEIATTISGYIFMHQRTNKTGRVFDGRTTFEFSPSLPRKEPDVAFVKLERLPVNIDDTVPLAPDLAVEVISGSDDWKEIVNKVRVYLGAGVKLVWVVDPYTQSVFVFRPETGNDFQKLHAEDELDGEDVISGFKLKVRLIFEETNPPQVIKS